VQARVAGIRATLERHGLAVRPEHMCEGESTIAFGRRSLRAIWEAPCERPTAIICGNDHIALGVLREAQELGIAIPDELSVTGFDDLEISKAIRPTLTTMRVDTYEIGQLTAQHLLDALDGKRPQRSHEVRALLHVRESSGPAATRAAG
jgi:LacI family transcriptional regulator